VPEDEVNIFGLLDLDSDNVHHRESVL